MLKLSTPPQRPPQHGIDDTVEWILPTDSAWDKDRVEAERAILAGPLEAEHDELEAKLKAAQDPGEAQELVDRLLEVKKARQAAVARHPVGVWYSCATRYSHDAQLTVPEEIRKDDKASCTIGDYLTGQPIRFVLRSLGARAFRKVNAADKDAWFIEAVKYGLVRIEQPDQDPIVPDTDPSGAIREWWLDWLDRHDRTLIDQLGAAIYGLARRGVDDEGKP